METREKTIEWNAGGRNVKVTVTITKGVEDVVAYADGWNVKTGRRTVNNTDIVIYIDGKIKTRGSEPEILNAKYYATKIAEGAYGRIGDMYFAKTSFERVMTCIAELNAEMATTPEYEDVEAEEKKAKEKAEKNEKEEQEKYKLAVKNGLCPTCGTYCYGDCGAN